MKKSLIAIQLVLFLQCTVCSYAQEVITSSSSSRESGIRYPVIAEENRI